MESCPGSPTYKPSAIFTGEAGESVAPTKFRDDPLCLILCGLEPLSKRLANVAGRVRNLRQAARITSRRIALRRIALRRIACEEALSLSLEKARDFVREAFAND